MGLKPAAGGHTEGANTNISVLRRYKVLCFYFTVFMGEMDLCRCIAISEDSDVTSSVNISDGKKDDVIGSGKVCRHSLGPTSVLKCTFGQTFEIMKKQNMHIQGCLPVVRTMACINSPNNF